MRSAAGAGAPPRATARQSLLPQPPQRPCHAVTIRAQPRGGRAGCLPVLGTGGNPNTAHTLGSVPLQWQLSHPHHGAGTGASCSYWTQISLQKYFLHNLGKSNSCPARFHTQSLGPGNGASGTERQKGTQRQACDPSTTRELPPRGHVRHAEPRPGRPCPCPGHSANQDESLSRPGWPGEPPRAKRFAGCQWAPRRSGSRACCNFIQRSKSSA